MKVEVQEMFILGEVKTERERKLKAVARILVDDCLCINSVKVIQGMERLFCAFPSEKDKKGNITGLVYPTNQETRDVLESAILGRYYEELHKQQHGYDL